MHDIRICAKCTKEEDVAGPLSLHGVCDLKPSEGYTGPCALKRQMGQLDLDDGEEGASIMKKPKKARPNARKREEDRQKKYDYERE